MTKHIVSTVNSDGSSERFVDYGIEPNALNKIRVEILHHYPRPHDFFYYINGRQKPQNQALCIDAPILGYMPMYYGNEKEAKAWEEKTNEFWELSDVRYFNPCITNNITINDVKFTFKNGEFLANGKKFWLGGSPAKTISAVLTAFGVPHEHWNTITKKKWGYETTGRMFLSPSGSFVIVDQLTMDDKAFCTRVVDNQRLNLTIERATGPVWPVGW